MQKTFAHPYTGRFLQSPDLSAKLVAISVPLTLYNAVELGELVVGGSQILQGRIEVSRVFPIHKPFICLTQQRYKYIDVF